jgi:hypothetical protein
MCPRTRVTVPVLCLVTILMTASLWAQEKRDEETELAKKTQNPVADLISVSFQSNFNFGAGTNDATIYILNVQPVIPLKLTEDWNLITRTIMPIINQPSLFPGDESAFGLGDINPTLFLSPAKPGKLIWGVGPTFTLPTATDSRLGSGKWSMGPAAVALTMQGPWVVGALANQQWSFAGWRDQAVSQLPPAGGLRWAGAGIDSEPTEVIPDPDWHGMLATLGIVQGKPFNPDERQKKILTEAARVGEIMARTIAYEKRFANAVVWPGKPWEYANLVELD